MYNVGKSFFYPSKSELPTYTATFNVIIFKHLLSYMCEYSG